MFVVVGACCRKRPCSVQDIEKVDCNRLLREIAAELISTRLPRDLGNVGVCVLVGEIVDVGGKGGGPRPVVEVGCRAEVILVARDAVEVVEHLVHAWSQHGDGSGGGSVV